MKKILLAFSALLFAVMSSAMPPMPSVSKLFDAAIKAGRAPASGYIFSDPSAGTTYSEVQNYASKNDYIILNKELKSVTRFGGVADMVVKVIFLPRLEAYDYMVEYAIEKITGESILYSSFSGKPKASFFSNIDGSFSNIRDNGFQYLSCHWSGNVVDGLIDGEGVGVNIWVDNGGTHFYIFSGNFKKGWDQNSKHPFCHFWNKDDMYWLKNINQIKQFWTADYTVGDFRGGVASFKAEGGYSGFINKTGKFVLTLGKYEIISEFPDVSSSGSYAVVKKQSDGLEWKVNSAGVLYEYSDNQVAILAAQKAEAERQAELKRQEEERQRILAEKKAAEEKRIAEAKMRAYKEKCKANTNINLWHIGDRLCYNFDEYRQGPLITATLESWNSDKSRALVKIVTSPSASANLDGESLSKNNRIWIPTHGGNWHLALDEEIERGIKEDRSRPGHTERYLKVCPYCDGKKGYKDSWRGWKTCERCNGLGVVEDERWVED